MAMSVYGALQLDWGFNELGRFLVAGILAGLVGLG
jgi:hypothetical protein